jgi:hypothetical protein
MKPQLVEHTFVKGDERAREAGRKSAAVRAERKRIERLSNIETVDQLHALTEACRTVDLADASLTAAIWAIAQVTAGKVPLRHGEDVAALVRALVDVARLINGQPTSTSAIVHMSAAEANARLRELSEQAYALSNASTSAAAVAAADTPVASEPPIEQGYPPPPD